MKFKILLLFILMCVLPFGLAAQDSGISGDSEINRCEVKSYTISMENTSGFDLTNLVVVAKLENLTGFSYVPGTTSMDVNGGGAFCTANPAASPGYSGNCASTPSGSYLVWDLDSLCGAQTLSNGSTLNITFQLETGCTAVSGSLNTLIDYTYNSTDDCDETGVLNIQVNPGAVVIKKTPNVIPQELGQNVTWTIQIENTGFGVIENVEVTDVLGAGLQYDSSTQSGNNSGQTTTWTSNEYAALASMDPGDILTMDIEAQVIACENLDNVADVQFGCSPSPTTPCYNTADNAGASAVASVQRIAKTPVIAFTPPDIDFTYCDDTESVQIDITNDGDGSAFQLYTIIDFAPLTVSNVVATPLDFVDGSFSGSYSVGDTRFEFNNEIPPSGTFRLTFDLTFDSSSDEWCGDTFPTGDLLWQKRYLDQCNQLFYPPVELSQMNAPSDQTGLLAAKTNGPIQISIDGSITYNISSSYTGPTSCGSGSTGVVTVVDTLPEGCTVTNAGGGTWDNTAGPTGDGTTGGTITWTYAASSSLSTSIEVDVPTSAECELYCNTVMVNNLEATVTDCCGCDLSATDSQETAIECAEGVTSSKTNNSPQERCSTVSYTNTYTFSGGSGVSLNALTFTENAENNQEYATGTVSVDLSGTGDITGSVGINDTTPGGTLELDFSGAAATPLAGRTLTITYDLDITASTLAACTSSTFYSWSDLEMGPSGSSCLGNGVIHEVTQVSIGTPGMSVAVDGLGQIYHTCETKTITLTVTQTTDYNPKDVRVVLTGLNYFAVTPGSTSGSGVATTGGNYIPAEVGGNYVWEFGDNFTGSGQTATITIDVQKRCTGDGNLDATVYWDDACTDDANYDDTCSAVGSETPTLLLMGDILIEKTPETYYAAENKATWVIYVTNRGTGKAYNVWVDDVLGSGLSYDHVGDIAVVVPDTGDVTITDGLDHTGSAINGVGILIDEMDAGERRQITLTADQIACTGLTNNVTANWGCVGAALCQTDVTDDSVVELPAPNLINTNTGANKTKKPADCR